MVSEKDLKKKKKKIWVPILAPKDFNEKEIGETHVYDPIKTIGKRISYNLSFLLADSKKQHIKLLFEIKEVKENKAITELIGYETISAYLKRLSKISKEKIDLSMKFKTKDNISFVIKIVAFVKNRTTNKVLKELNKMLETNLKKNLDNKDYDEIAKDIIFAKLQKTLQGSLKKIIPISGILVRKFQRLK